MGKIKIVMCSLVLVTFAGSVSAVTAVFSHEIVNGPNKICVYTSYKGSHSLDLPAWQPCPATIDV